MEPVVKIAGSFALARLSLQQEDASMAKYVVELLTSISGTLMYTGTNMLYS